MDRIAALRWMNRHPRASFWALVAIGYLVHLLYEYVHWPKPVMAALVLVAAGIAGWAVDLLFTKGEEEAGEID